MQTVGVDVLACYLEDTHDASGTVGFIREQWPRSLAPYVSAVKKQWLTFDRHHELYPEDAETATAKAQTLLEEDSRSSKAVDALLAFTDLSLADKVKAQRKAKAYKFSGDARVDDLVSAIRVLPDYMKDFRLNEQEKLSVKSRAKLALEKKACTTWTVNAGKLLDDARATIESDISHPFDLAAAVSVLTGRRMVEVFKMGCFEKVAKNNRAALFSGQAKSDGDTSAYVIPLLCEFSTLAKGLDRLRRMKPSEDLTNAEVNARWSGRCNAAARRLLGEGRRFHDLREAYAVITFNLSLPHAWSLNFWVSRMLGHSDMSNSLHYTCLSVEGVREEDRFEWKDAITGGAVPLRP